MVESEADRAALFSADEFGTDAFYKPPAGAEVPCVIILDHSRPEAFEAEAGRAGARGSIAWQRAQILGDQIASVVKGGQVRVGTRRWTIPSKPDQDESGEIWTVDLQELPA